MQVTFPKELDEKMKKDRAELEAKLQSIVQQVKKEDDEAKKRDERIEKEVADRLVALTGKMTTIQAQLAKAEEIQKAAAKPEDLKAVVQKVLPLEARLAAIEARLAKLEAK